MVALGVVPAAYCQTIGEGATAGSISIVPRISITETFTDNVFLTSTGARSELITQVSPGIYISSRGGRISGFLDYSLTELLYARNSSGRRTQNALSAFATAEIIDKSGYVDFSGVISQQAISAFGAPTSNVTAVNGNSTETSVFRISPHMRGRIPGVADYAARYSLTSSRSGSATASDVDSRDLSVQLNGVGGRIGSGWTLGASHQVFDYSVGRTTEAQRVNGQFNFPFNAQFGAYIKAGHESNNYTVENTQQDNFTAIGVNWTPNEEARVSIDKDSRGAIGLVAFWAPSKRTSIAITRERRLFGDTHSIALSYRTPKTAWTFSDTRGVVANPAQPAVALSLHEILLGQFSAGEPDPIKREQYDAFLQANGIRPGATAVGGFVTSSTSLQRQQQLAFALFGARSTLSLVATRSNNTKLNTVATGLDDFSTSDVIVQNGLSANYSYRLTPRSLLSVVAARQSSSGSSGQKTSSKSVQVNLSATLTKDATASVTARRVVFDSSTAPYTENAVIGNLNVQF